MPEIGWTFGRTNSRHGGCDRADKLSECQILPARLDVVAQNVVFNSFLEGIPKENKVLGNMGGSTLVPLGYNRVARFTRPNQVFKTEVGRNFDLN